MTGKWLDVTVQLQSRSPQILLVDCINPGLVPSVACFRHNNSSQAVQVNSSNFYQICAVHMASLHNIQEILNVLHIKYYQAKYMHWLSHENAIKPVICSLFSNLDRETSENSEPTGHDFF